MREIIKDLKSARELMTSGRKDNFKLKLADFNVLLPYLKKNWKKFLVGAILMVLLSLLSMPSPLLMKYVVDTVIPGKDFTLLHLVVLGLLALYLVKVVVSFLMNYLFNRLSQKVMMEVKRDLFSCILRLPLSFFDKNQTGYIMSRIGEVSRLNLFFSSVISQVVISVFEFMLCLGILFYMNWRLTIAALWILPLYYLVSRTYSKGLRTVSQQVMEKGAQVSRQFQESLAGVDTIKLFTAENRETGKLGKSLNEFMTSNIIQTIIHGFSGQLLGIIGITGVYVVLWYSAFEIMKGQFTLGGYIAFSAYLAKLYNPTEMLANLGLTLQPAAAALSRVAELFNMTDENGGQERNIKLTSLQGKIELKDLSFSYNEDQEEALKSINLTINPGDKIALIGPNGSGKSTIIKLLLGFYPVKKGKILIDDKDLNTLVLADLRERISVVSQNIFLFNDTIKENIRYSSPKAGDEQVIEAARLAGAFDFITKLDKGFDTTIGEVGKTLSGGERQKIAIARAILKDADIIIFDEATSNLDNASVSRIEALVENHFKTRTVIVIAHRLTCFHRFDQVIRLEHGLRQENHSHAAVGQAV